MRVSRHKRQVFLFVIAILVPATVLIGLASRRTQTIATATDCPSDRTLRPD